MVPKIRALYNFLPRPNPSGTIGIGRPSDGLIGQNKYRSPSGVGSRCSLNVATLLWRHGPLRAGRLNRYVLLILGDAEATNSSITVPAVLPGGCRPNSPFPTYG